MILMIMLFRNILLVGDKREIYLNPADPDTILVKGMSGSQHSLWSVSQQNILIEWDTGY